MVDRFKCFDDFKDFVAGEEYSVAVLLTLV